MSKEEVLELLKHLVLQVIDNGEKLKSDERFKADWKVKNSILDNAIKSLNSCDCNWVNDKYGEWHRKEIVPRIDNLKDKK
jgi:hypothetical protein